MVNVSGYNKALALLQACSTEFGFVASFNDTDNYKRVWTRDGSVCVLASLLSDDPLLIETSRKTMQVIFEHQHPIGFIASHISASAGVSYGGAVGRTDNTCWAVIGLCAYLLKTEDTRLRETYRAHVEKCFHVLDIWEYNARHLVYVPQSGDWADEYFQHGYILFDQLLRLAALRAAAKIYYEESWSRKADDITRVIKENYWLDPHKKPSYSSNFERQAHKISSDYWILGFNPSTIYEQFDLQANALALLLNISEKWQMEKLIRCMNQKITSNESVLPSFDPAVQETDPDFRQLQHNFMFRFKNYPHQFHNGGLWPIWNGFMAAALFVNGQSEVATELLGRIHRLNEKESWSFNECFHGQTGEATGTAHCAWSAAGVVIAEAALAGKPVLPFQI
jgi:GH15 family glucan-1,4-alpha-glucosidase